MKRLFFFLCSITLFTSTYSMERIKDLLCCCRRQTVYSELQSNEKNRIEELKKLPHMAGLVVIKDFLENTINQLVPIIKKDNNTFFGGIEVSDSSICKIVNGIKFEVEKDDEIINLSVTKFFGNQEISRLSFNKSVYQSADVDAELLYSYVIYILECLMKRLDLGSRGFVFDDPKRPGLAFLKPIKPISLITLSSAIEQLNTIMLNVVKAEQKKIDENSQLKKDV